MARAASLQKEPWKRPVFFLFALLVVFGLRRYQQSSLLIAQGDALLRQQKPEQAITIYQKAYDLFPFRPDVSEDLKGARLILESDIEYSTISQVGAEIQEAPPIGALPQVPLKPNEYRVPILMYHHIRINPRPNDPIWAALNVSVEQLDSQLQYLVSHGYHIITLDDLYPALSGRSALPSNPIILTFDDGYRSFYDNAFPLLKKYHARAVEFVITAVLTAPAYLTWDEIAEMDQTGLVQFAAHTRHHPNLPDLSHAAIVDEIKGSKDDLEAHLKKSVNWFAYPYGSYSQTIIQVVQEAGFFGAVSTIYGSVQSNEKIFLLPRIMVDGRYTLDNVARRLQ